MSAMYDSKAENAKRSSLLSVTERRNEIKATTPSNLSYYSSDTLTPIMQETSYARMLLRKTSNCFRVSPF